jgi:ATP-dependent Clp protease ATP-binding subunit ClpA
MARLKMLLDATKVGPEAETLEEKLRARIVGQDAAIRQIVDVYQTFLAGMCPTDRPVGNFLFLGPTGSGKTRTVEAVAESLAGEKRAVVKIDCAEYQHGHEIAKLIGSPPGYLGHKETHPLLCQETLDQHLTEDCKLSFVLFDEIEKASDTLWNLLLGILDKATLTLGDNRRVDFSHCMIFMTSNLGAAEMESILRPKLGFTFSALTCGEVSGRMASAGASAARRRFSPEFMNRIDKTVVFNPLGSNELRRVLDLELEAVRGRILTATGAASLNCTLDDAAREYLLAEGTDPRYGARHLKRAVERLLVQPLSNLIATGQVRSDDQVLVEYDRDAHRLIFSKDPAEPVPASLGTAA